MIATQHISAPATHRFPARWKLSELPEPTNGTVFSTFSGGGGSSMGYKLAGFDVIGACDIDPKMMDHYIRNLHPKYHFTMPIKDLMNEDLPDAFFNLDILDGSPPCTTFSTSNRYREDHWGVERRFKEGRAKQVLDELFFDFIDLAEHLKPKIVIAENVKGLLMGNARAYVRRIYAELDKAGYYTQHFLLNAKYMGVPQHRNRVFFIGVRKDLAGPYLQQVDLFRKLPIINMEFAEPIIPCGSFLSTDDDARKPLSPSYQEWYDKREGYETDLKEIFKRHNNGLDRFWNVKIDHPDKPAWTLTGQCCQTHIVNGKFMLGSEAIRIQTFPEDYDIPDTDDAGYVAGMSVPPVMIANIAARIVDEWPKILNS